MPADPRRPRVWISESASVAISDAASAAHPDEIGGVLIGVYIGGRRPWIVEAIAVPSEHAGTHHYVLPAGARPRAARAAGRRDPRLGYVGDWHSHPADVGPSRRDRETIRDVGADDQDGALRPLLLIARRTHSDYRLDARQLIRGRLRRTRVILAGGLGPRDPLQP